MFYIKLDDNMNLVITVKNPIYRGDNLNQKIIYLIPTTVEEIDIAAATVYLMYIRADGVPDIITLEPLEEKYNDTYYQYTFPINCKLTRFPGEVCTWIQIFTGTPSNPVTAKSGECMLYVQDSKNIDDYLSDQQITAIYQLQKGIDENAEKIDSGLSGKADNISYDDETRKLQRVSNGEAIGDAVTVPSDKYAEDIEDKVEDSWSSMTDPDDGDMEEEWEPM